MERDLDKALKLLDKACVLLNKGTTGAILPGTAVGLVQSAQFALEAQKALNQSHILGNENAAWAEHNRCVVAMTKLALQALNRAL